MASGLQPIVLDPAYNHDKWQTLPQDKIFQFAAYTTSFDSADNNDKDGDPDKWGIPEWVAFEIKRVTTEHHLEKRPKWMTDEALHNEGVAPDDQTYAVSGVSEIKEVKTDYRFVRGHMCPKDTAERISADAAYNTHTVLNAVPQLQWQNNGIWKTLEQQCNDWADKFGQVWVICGPVFFGKSPAMWLGQDGETKAAIPDALFKIVIREDGGVNGVDTLAFLIPNILPKSERDLSHFLTSIDRVEALTGLDFMTILDDDIEKRVEVKETESVEW
ncbi:DNA/RNA non-specific endonuclease [Desulfocicer niacini]